MLANTFSSESSEYMHIQKYVEPLLCKDEKCFEMKDQKESGF